MMIGPLLHQPANASWTAAACFAGAHGMSTRTRMRCGFTLGGQDWEKTNGGQEALPPCFFVGRVAPLTESLYPHPLASWCLIDAGVRIDLENKLQKTKTVRLVAGQHRPAWGRCTDGQEGGITGVWSLSTAPEAEHSFRERVSLSLVVCRLLALSSAFFRWARIGGPCLCVFWSRKVLRPRSDADC